MNERQNQQDPDECESRKREKEKTKLINDWCFSDPGKWQYTGGDGCRNKHRYAARQSKPTSVDKISGDEFPDVFVDSRWTTEYLWWETQDAGTLFPLQERFAGGKRMPPPTE